MDSSRRAPRIAHVGLGAFARSHQAWYTDAASDDWGIVAVTGRVGPELAAQGFRYGLIVRGPESDTAAVIDSVVGLDADAIANPEVAVVTVTVTEAGYVAGARPPVLLTDGLEARRVAGGGAIAIVPCDNLPSNGMAVRDAVLAVAAPELASWIDDNVSFVSTMVDRITPATTSADVAIAEELLGWHDAVPVVTEPFTEWVLQGDFPAGRPEWEVAGARFVDDVKPYEQRKLWMLNAAHSLLAYRGLERGHETVFDAFADATLAAEVAQLWDEARPVLTMDAQELDAWLAALRIRWQNPRIEHRLEQIALGGEQKIPARIDSVIRERERAGLSPGTAELDTIDAYKRYRKAHTQ
ncbi:MAG TPA: mannitol dehydrogenase family protein [Galbitalea sp.]|jgi:fructuronate reductase|nr:mannitol dehydrogenase family protein [Galbitalea sp.]